MLISTSQINQVQLAALIALYSSGSAFSGNLLAYANGSGTFGPNIVYTYGDQVITGRKRFYLSPDVPYYDGTGRAPSALYVQTQDLAVSGVLNGYVNSLSGFVIGASGALSIVRVTGSSPISIANFSGLGGTLVIYSGGQIFISGAAGGGGGGSNLSVTGSTAISAPNLTGAGSVSVYYDGTYVTFSGSAPAIDTSSLVTTTGNELIGGFKQFTGSPFVPYPTQPSGATNLFALTGASGALSARDSTISGVLYNQMTGISGSIIAGSSITNNYFITGTGVITASSTGIVTNTFNITSGNAVVNSSGTVANIFNGTTYATINQPTGNFVNMSFWFDEYSLTTGLNLTEALVGRDFLFTGYAIGAINSGTQGSFSGSFYQRNQTSVKTTFVSFGMAAGQFFSGRGGFSQTVSGLNRVGLDIYSIGTGLTGLSIGLFGVGY